MWMSGLIHLDDIETHPAQANGSSDTFCMFIAAHYQMFSTVKLAGREPPVNVIVAIMHSLDCKMFYTP